MQNRHDSHIDFALDLDFSEILSNPILDIAARVWDHDRYEAFQICYRSMRVIDDLVDNQKSVGRQLSRDEQNLFASMIDDWINSLRRRRAVDFFQEQLLETMEKFRLPLWPWEKLATAMLYDLYNNGFATFHRFLRYTEGAAISPAAVFMHLCGVNLRGDTYQPPLFDIRAASRPLALFSYLVHIMRDFQKDQRDHLNYFATTIMADEGVSELDLQQAAGCGEIVRPVRDLMQRYKSLAEYYRARARRQLDHLLPRLEPRYQLSLEIIYGLYHQIFQRVNPETGNFTTAEHNPSPEEVQAELDRIITSFQPAN